MKFSHLFLLLSAFFLTGCGPRELPEGPGTGPYSATKLIPPRKFCIIEEKLMPLQVTLKTDGPDTAFGEQIQQYITGHVKSDAVRIIREGASDLTLVLHPLFREVSSADKSGGQRLDCDLEVSLTPANGYQRYATKRLFFTSQKAHPDREKAKMQYVALAGEELSVWTVQQLDVISQTRINAVNIRIGLRNPAIQLDAYKQEKEVIEIGNFISNQKGVISSKLIEFDEKNKLCTFHVVFFAQQLPERLSGILTEKFR